MKVEFYRHSLQEEDIQRLADVCRGVFLTTGKEVKEFEEKFAAYLGAQYCVGLTSATAGLHIALLAFDVGPGDEVITTPMTFAATSNTIFFTGATPVFVDVEPATGLMDMDLLERAITPKTKAIIAVHLYGQMVDMRRLKSIADRHGLKIIEDCAHAIESERDGVRPGQLSDASCFSYYATKNITCGEGGSVVTNSQAVNDKLRLLRQHGLSTNAADRYAGAYKHWDIELLGWKYNMTNLQAALLIGQIARIESLWAKREAISQRYEAGFAGVAGVSFPIVMPGTKSARHLFTIWVDPSRRDEVLADLQAREVGVAVNYRAVHLLKYYQERLALPRGTFPVTERIGDSTLTLPLYPSLGEPEVDFVIESVKAAVGSTTRV
ncbi:MAG TPA: DegT/DnrJ/EryC1/StrS family aminotransferase [Vicinamibacterales bacterium]|nr:DegT/DnrJ/EryC1/StrS family aminotransferase [Vicinamibacterales bacterium]